MMRSILATTLVLLPLSPWALAQVTSPRATPPERSAPSQLWNCTNPIAPENGVASACLVARTFWSATEAELVRANGNPNQELTTLRLESTAYTGGSNQPVRSFGKTTYLGSKTTGAYNTMGQHVLVEATQNCFAPGDCLVGSRFLNHANGVRDSSDEGVHLFDTQILETPYVPIGRCARGCTRSSGLISLTDADAWSASGEGRYLGDMTRSETGTGRITGATLDRDTGFTEVEITGGELPVSKLLKIPLPQQSRPGEIDPGGVTVEIATASLPRGFTASTAGIAPQGILCLADIGGANPEMAPYRALDATHLSLRLRKQHEGAMVAAVGGTCGLGISLIADDAVLLPNHRTPIRQVIPIYGSRGPGSVLLNPQTHLGQNLSSNAFFSLSCPIASLERRSGIVTLEATGDLCHFLNGLPATLTGMPPRLAVTTPVLRLQQLTDAGAIFRYDAPGPDLHAGPGGTLSYNNGAYRLVPIAETTRVLNPDTGHPDGGNIALAPNLIPFAPGDQIEQFHFHLALTGGAGEQFQTQYTPEIDVPTNTTGVVFANGGGGAVAGPGKIAFRCSNAEADSQLLGYGGTHVAPWMCLRADGAFRNVLDAEWITNGSILRLHPLHHQQRNATPFWLVSIEPGNGDDGGLRYIPDAHALEFHNLHAVAPTYTTTRGTPRSSTEPCTPGESWDATDVAGGSFHYFCRAPNTLVRVRMDSF